MNSDISSLLIRIKQGIIAVESGRYSQLYLDSIESDTIAMLELLKLFLISERDSYYGYILMNLAFEINFRSKIIAGIKLNTFPPIFLSNPLILCKFDLKEIIYIICHEIDHILLNHPAEMAKIKNKNDPDLYEKFNIAADASVNDRINQEIKDFNRSFLSQPDGIITSTSLEEQYKLTRVKNLESYLYYFNLIKDKDTDSSQQQPQQMFAAGTKEDSDDKSKENFTRNRNADDETTDNVAKYEDELDDRAIGREEIVNAKNIDGFSDHEWEAGDHPEDAEALAKELINAADSMMSKEVRGLMSGHYLEQVRMINEPPAIAWQSLLKKYVGTIAAGKRSTRMRLNRRQPFRYDLSGRVDEKVLKIVVAIDTSGSMSNKAIAKVMGEIFDILASRKHELTIIECDVKVQRVYRVPNRESVKNKVSGRGGTLFTPVIEHINEDKYYRDALLIYFTDGFGEKIIPRPRTYRNLWVVLGNENNLSLKEPYGAVIAL